MFFLANCSYFKSLTTRSSSSGESEAEQAIYYSDWIYTAVHMALTIPELQNIQSIQRFLRYSPKRIGEAMDFLIGCGLAIKDKESFKAGSVRTHLPEDSHMISRHHQNWRLRAIRSLESDRREDLHYSSVFSASHETISHIREMVIKIIKDSDELIRDAKEETLHSFCIDYFSVDARKKGSSSKVP